MVKFGFFLFYTAVGNVFSVSIYCQQMSWHDKYPVDQVATAHAAKFIVNHQQIQAFECFEANVNLGWK